VGDEGHSGFGHRVDFAYVRSLGNRKGIEEQTTTWDKTVIDRQDDLKSWVAVLRRLVKDNLVDAAPATAILTLAPLRSQSAYALLLRFTSPP
jgi:hypothetical protein